MSGMHGLCTFLTHAWISGKISVSKRWEEVGAEEGAGGGVEKEVKGMSRSRIPDLGVC